MLSQTVTVLANVAEMWAMFSLSQLLFKSLFFWVCLSCCAVMNSCFLVRVVCVYKYLLAAWSFYRPTLLVLSSFLLTTQGLMHGYIHIDGEIQQQSAIKCLLFLNSCWGMGLQLYFLNVGGVTIPKTYVSLHSFKIP